MIAFSSNDATSALVARLHAVGVLAPASRLEAAFAARGLGHVASVAHAR
jgi:hypothetical protein